MTKSVMPQGKNKANKEVETLESIKSEVRYFIRRILGNKAFANGADPVQEIIRRMS